MSSRDVLIGVGAALTMLGLMFLSADLITYSKKEYYKRIALKEGTCVEIVSARSNEFEKDKIEYVKILQVGNESYKTMRYYVSDSSFSKGQWNNFERVESFKYFQEYKIISCNELDDKTKSLVQN